VKLLPPISAVSIQGIAHMDVYANHLAQLNRSHRVTASEDICNAQGLKLLARGASLDEASLAKLARQKLLKPLDSSVGITGQLDSTRLTEAFTELAAQQADGEGLLTLLPRPLAELCAHVDRQPLLCQRLTVMREVFPLRFQRSLFGALLTMAMVKTGGWQGLSLPSLFVAGLARAIGLLHLPESLMQGEIQANADLQHLFESHPVISLEILRGSIDPVTADAILNQHEHLDYSGFPRGYRAGPPSREAQLLGAADWLAWLCLEQIGGQANALGYARAPLRLVRQFWSEPVYHAANELIDAIGGDYRPLVSESQRPDWLDQLLAHQRQMARQWQQLAANPPQENSQNGPQGSRMLASLHSICTSSGLLSPEYERWIEHVQTQRLSAAYAELDDVHLQLCSLEPLLQRTHLLLAKHAQPADAAMA
jgi:HD-GYP domain-containing protein (c-di-GMP phosphodiesterase class II)